MALLRCDHRTQSPSLKVCGSPCLGGVHSRVPGHRRGRLQMLSSALCGSFSSPPNARPKPHRTFCLWSARTLMFLVYGNPTICGAVRPVGLFHQG